MFPQSTTVPAVTAARVEQTLDAPAPAAQGEASGSAPTVPMKRAGRLLRAGGGSEPAKWGAWVQDAIEPYVAHGDQRGARRQSLYEMLSVAPLSYRARMQLANLKFCTIAELPFVHEDNLPSEDLAGDSGWVDDDVVKVRLLMTMLNFMRQAHQALSLTDEWVLTHELALQTVRAGGFSASQVYAHDLFDMVAKGGARFDDLFFGLGLDYAKFAQLVLHADQPEVRVDQPDLWEQFYRNLRCSYIKIWRRLCNAAKKDNDWISSWRLFWRLRLRVEALQLLGCSMPDLVRDRHYYDLGAMQYLGYEGLCKLGLTYQLLCMVPGAGGGQLLEQYCTQTLKWTPAQLKGFLNKYL